MDTALINTALMDTALPCPFCGTEPDIQEIGRYSYVICKSCEVQPYMRAETMERAIKVWNKRYCKESAQFAIAEAIEHKGHGLP